MKGVGGQKMSVFVHAQGIKTVHTRGWGPWIKMAKFLPRSCWMPPNVGELLWVPISSPPSLLHWHSGICFDTVHTLFWRFFFGTMHSEYMYVVCSQHQLIRGDVALLYIICVGIAISPETEISSKQTYCIDNCESSLTQCRNYHRHSKSKYIHWHGIRPLSFLGFSSKDTNELQLPNWRFHGQLNFKVIKRLDSTIVVQ